MEDFRKIFGEALTRRRKKLDVSQVEFAQKVGLIQQTYARYENGEQMVKADVLHQMASRIGVSMEDLLLGNDIDSSEPAQIRESGDEIYGRASDRERQIIDLAASLPGAVGTAKKLLLDKMRQAIDDLERRPYEGRPADAPQRMVKYRNPIASNLISEAELKGALASAEASHQAHERGESSPIREADEPTSQTESPSGGASKGSKGRPELPGQAPK